MKIMVQKFGGTSVQDDESRKSAMRHIEHAVNEGYKVAKDRDIKKIGYKLKKVYEYVLEKDLINK